MVTEYRFEDDAERVRSCLTAAHTRQNAEGCVKVWEDLDRYRAVLKLTNPTLVIETGTHTGASASWFAMRVPRVITVDVADRWTEEAPANVVPLVGDSVSGSVVDTIRRMARRGVRVMVVLDSDHSAAHVEAEIDAYGPLVTPGFHLVVEDAIARWMPGENEHGSPWDAIGSRLRGNPEWTQDETTRDRHAVTMYPDGWWVRNAS